MPAIIIGLGAGVLCYLAVQLLIRLNIDDSLSVWGVHGIGGTWGALATGIFVGVGFGSFAELAAESSRGMQIVNQLIGIGASWAWSFILTAVILLALKYTMGLRVSDDEEGGRAGRERTCRARLQDVAWVHQQGAGQLWLVRCMRSVIEKTG